MPKRERMSSVDTAWLRMDRPTNLMMIIGVMIFDGAMDYGRLKQVIAERFCTFRRFRQCVVADVAGTHWEDAEEFEVEAHVKRTALPGKGGKAELQRLVADLANAPLDPSRPLWQFLLVENYDGGSALVARIHHCIADGIALIGVLLAMTDESPEGGAGPSAPATEGAEAGDDEEQDFWSKLVDPVAGAASTTLKITGVLRDRLQALLADPQQALDYARTGAGILGELAELALMPDDSPTRLKGTPGHAKCVAWSEPIPLEDVKALGKALGCSVNDVLLSSVAGALGRYLAERGDVIDGVELRALVPVNLRPPGRSQKLGNQFGLVALELPVGMTHPLERLYEVRRRMLELKGSMQAAVTLGLLGFVGMCPKPVQDMILDILAAKATAVMTNVPGPQKPLYLAGARLAQQMFWVPQSGNIGIGVSILSYNECVQFGLITDRRLLPDPERVIAQFRPEFERALYLTLLGPWGKEEEALASEAPAAPTARPSRRGAGRKTAAPQGTGRRPNAATPAAPETPVSVAPPVAAPRVPKRFR